ncbi:MAG: inositol monophosphatase [Opitutaceae bacterium]|jgi:fructose-1,6-bisphosphatase/inositol monophosphatase family enzyme|nr:inositol monophosphatase [Opitutaceae bacterium]
MQHARRLLCSLQNHIRQTLLDARARHAARFARVEAVTHADTIYHIDTISEAAITAWFERHWPRAWPVQVVMEGIEDDTPLTFPRGTPVKHTRHKCILDPIDGTRGLMYDKRPGWILAALAPQRGPRTNLADITVAAMTELPLSKQWRAEQFSAIRGAGPRGVRGTWTNVLTGATGRVRPAPSQAAGLEHGFASVAKYFPDGKVLLAQFEEKLWAALQPPAPDGGGSPLIFDDQYIATGGQLHELLSGHDRITVDVRPAAFAKLGLPASLTCHPYDICAALILPEAGCIVEAPAGGALRAPLDTTTPVSWIGYANPVLARRARPVVKRLLREFFGE